MLIYLTVVWLQWAPIWHIRCFHSVGADSLFLKCHTQHFLTEHFQVPPLTHSTVLLSCKVLSTNRSSSNAELHTSPAAQYLVHGIGNTHHLAEDLRFYAKKSIQLNMTVGSVQLYTLFNLADYRQIKNGLTCSTGPMTAFGMKFNCMYQLQLTDNKWVQTWHCSELPGLGALWAVPFLCLITGLLHLSLVHVKNLKSPWQFPGRGINAHSTAPHSSTLSLSAWDRIPSH